MRSIRHTVLGGWICGVERCGGFHCGGGSSSCFLFLVCGCLFVQDNHILDHWLFVVHAGGGFFDVIF